MKEEVGDCVLFAANRCCRRGLYDDDDDGGGGGIERMTKQSEFYLIFLYHA